GRSCRSGQGVAEVAGAAAHRARQRPAVRETGTGRDIRAADRRAARSAGRGLIAVHLTFAPACFLHTEAEPSVRAGLFGLGGLRYFLFVALESGGEREEGEN
ncbi:hypothetical protein PENTCL1PPCAC_14140, partial [Pristionchus entomophagus]